MNKSLQETKSSGEVFFVLLKNLCNDVNSNTGRVGSVITSLGGMSFGISGDTYGYYKNGQLVGFKNQADIDAAYQSGYNTGYTAGEAAGVTIHTGTYNVTSNGTTDLGVHHSYRYINTNVTPNDFSFEIHIPGNTNYAYINKIDMPGIKSISTVWTWASPYVNSAIYINFTNYAGTFKQYGPYYYYSDTNNNISESFNFDVGSGDNPLDISLYRSSGPGGTIKFLCSF